MKTTLDATSFAKHVCPVFAEVQLDEQEFRTQWPDRAVPTAILQGAQAMDTLHTFNPTLDGPASMKAATCNLPSSENNPQVIDDDDGVAATEHGGVAATEHESTSHLDLPAEFLIGMHEENAHDPVDLMIVFQKNLELVQEAGKRIYKLERQRVQAARTEEAADAAITLRGLPLRRGMV